MLGKHKIKNAPVIAAVTAALLLSGCAQAVLTAGATAGVAIAQERSLGNAIDDAAINLLIKDKLLDLSGDLFIRVNAKSVEGRVLITGSVNNPEDRVEVSRVTWQVKGVREVYNELEVRDRSGVKDYFRDLRITNELRLRLMGNRNISAINYSVESVNQIIYLMGISKTQAEMNSVVEQARNIKGVEKVVSYILLSEDTRRN